MRIGLGSSPANVMARSRLFLPPGMIAGADEDADSGGGEVGADVGWGGAPLPSSISNSAHSHEIWYLLSILWNARMSSCGVCGAGDGAGLVFERMRDGGFGRPKRVGVSARE